MPKPLTPHHEPSHENNHPNQALPNPYIKDTPTSPQVVSYPPLPISPINSHVTHTQAPPQSENQTQHTSPLSPSRESLVDDINQLQDLSNLLAMHLSQQQNNIPSSPYSPNLPHTLNINQVETHVGYCPFYEEVIIERFRNGKARIRTSRPLALKVDKGRNSKNSSRDEEALPPKNNDQRAFILGAWSDNGEDEVEKTKDETCLVAQAPDEICLGINLEPDEWIKDNGCSKHMTGLFLHAVLDHLCHLAILCLDQHAHTLHHLESLLTISLDRLDILEEDLVYQSLRNESDSAGMRLQHRHLYLHLNVQFRRTSLTGFPAQSVRSSNVYALDSPYLLVLNTGTSQSRQHDMSESDSYYLSD
ncbi:hypothetical protein Tco_1282415 [Tanacetum coccineum]